MLNFEFVIIVVFWICFALLFYCYAGYPLFLFLINSIKRILKKKSPFDEPYDLLPVTLIVAMHNEAAVIEKKIQNTLAIRYPKEKLQVLFVDDGSTDGTSDFVIKYPFIQLLQQDTRKGKTAAIKTAMQQVQTPIVVFSDANSMLNSDCIIKMIRHFKNPVVGGVAGEKRVMNKDKVSVEAERFYWRYESFIKKQEADFCSTIGAAGELYCIRTSLFKLTDDHIITDDFLISMQVCLQGYRVAYEPGAFSTESPSASLEEEAKRKIRIATGAFQSIGHLKGALNFLKFPLLSFQYFSHRIVRWLICPFLLPLFLISTIVIIKKGNSDFYLYLFYFQLLFYLLAALGWLWVFFRKRAGIIAIPFYFVFMNVCQIRGLFVYLNKKHTVLWQKSLRTEISSIPD
ncbi:MAG: glycosyltransferase family 2 protein [Bacteroidetes bacterium]|nr:glycosyltransferase family 2 protein [Bacteroidota bacterium]MBS1632953.1 glycosyltransferase family 2 protein [Bacteroidota bacterium]